MSDWSSFDLQRFLNILLTEQLTRQQNARERQRRAPAPAPPRPVTPGPPGNLVEVIEPPTQPPPRDTSRDRPPKDDAFAGPLPVPVPPVTPPSSPPVTPPSSPPPVTPPASSPGPSVADQLPDSRQRIEVGRSVRVPTLMEAASRAGLVLWVLGTLVFQPFLRGPLTRPQGSGPPRRTRTPPTAAPPPAPRPWPDDPFEPRLDLPRLPGQGVPFPWPSSRTPLPTQPGGIPNALPQPRTVSPGARAMPGTRPTVRGVPAPAGWTLADPLPGPGYDPYTYAPPTGQPIHRPVSQPRGQPVVRPALPLPWLQPGVRPGPGLRPGTRPLTPQQPSTRSPPRTTPRAPPRTQPPTGLTPFQPPMPDLSPQPQPMQADPCRAAANTAQRERRAKRKKCKRFKTKTIRVCADK